MRLIFLVFTFFNVLFSQNNPVSFSSNIGLVARAGEVVNIQILASMENQWHIYSVHKITEGPLPTEISLSGDVLGSIGPIIEPEPEYVFDPGFDSETYYHAGDTKFSSFFRLKRGLQPGRYPINIEIYYMVCDERLCYPPKVKNNVVYVEVEEGSPRPDRTSFASLNDHSDNNKSKIDNSLLGILILAFGGAIISWIMPCVYPMIPIIISFFGKMSEEKNVSRFTIAFFMVLVLQVLLWQSV